MSFSFWYQICKIWWINKRVLTIWMETGIHFEKLQMLPFINTQICSSSSVQLSGFILQLLKTYVSPFKWLELCYLSTIPSSLLSKWRGHSLALHNKLLICLIWSVFVKLNFYKCPGTCSGFAIYFTVLCYLQSSRS